MPGEQKPVGADIAELKKELADIKNEMMRRELEDIKREKMRRELEEIKAERHAPARPSPVPYAPRISIPTLIMAMATLLAAGYILGTLYPFGLAAEVGKYLTQFGVLFDASLVLTIVSVVLLLIGMVLIMLAKK